MLSFAYKESDEPLSVDTEYNFIFLGLISMVDPPRPESVEAVADAKKAGIRPVMITGDHKITAVAIAKRIGIFEDGDMALTGAELDALTDAELDDRITKISVYARVSPENKIRIVEAWQRKGNIVSMTGDGVNDAPALKKADIGVAMGGLGSDAAIEAADIVIMTDETSKISKAINLSKKTMRIVRENIIFAIFVKIAVLVLTAFGASTMWEAVFADVGVSVIAIINALRMLNIKKFE